MGNKMLFKRKLLLYAIICITSVSMMTSCLSVKKTKLLYENEVYGAVDNTASTEYLLQSGDQLYIRVFSVDPKTSRLFQTDMPMHYSNSSKELNSFMIDKNGYINFSFIDKLYVKGLTIEGATSLIQKTINEYFKEATVVVKLAYYRVSVLGEVATPGSFNIEERQINILQAISKAGGVEPYGNRKKVTLIRKTNTGTDVQYLDLNSTDILRSEYFYLLPNDVVYVPPMNSKNKSFEKFPYHIILTMLSIGAAVFAVVND